MSEKELVYNPKTAEREIERLKKEVDYYKEHYELILQIHDTQVETIRTYNRIVRILETELMELKGENE